MMNDMMHIMIVSAKHIDKNEIELPALRMKLESGIRDFYTQYY